MTREDEAKDAMFDGVHARRAGRPFSDCPEPPGNFESQAWARGWNGEDRWIAEGGIAATVERVRRQREAEARVTNGAVGLASEIFNQLGGRREI